MGTPQGDTYEQQLEALFDSCGIDHQGYLDRSGLVRLCQKLPLDKDQSSQLIDILLKSSDSYVNFSHFRNGLLSFLGDDNASYSSSKTPEKNRPSFDRHESPEREVSPKLVLGQKKYGRRSKPENAKDDMVENNLASSSMNILSQEEEFLRSAWYNLGVGTDGYFDKAELAVVCEHIGFEKPSQEALQQLFEQLDTDNDGKISIEEFLLLYRSQKNCTNGTALWELSENDSSLVEAISDPHSVGTSLILDCNGIGMANAESIIEMWDSAGVSDAAHFLKDLGVDDLQSSVNVTWLSNLLEAKIEALSATSSVPSSLSQNLMQAILTLRQAEFKWVKSSMEQVIYERDKLRSDLFEANNRANFLAQEIDDHHSKMEKFSQNQVKLLEQKHADVVKELSMQLSQEREQLMHQNSQLEKRISILQQNEAKLLSEIAVLRAENESLEQESKSLVEQISDHQKEKKKVEKDLQEMVILQKRLSELEMNNEQEDVQSLVQKLNELKCENSTLRDRNDELTVEVEILSTELSNLKMKKIANSNNSDGGGGVCIAAKRRSHPHFNATLAESEDEENPRVGKIRRFSYAEDAEDSGETGVELGLATNTSTCELNQDSQELIPTNLQDPEKVDEIGDEPLVNEDSSVEPVKEVHVENLTSEISKNQRSEEITKEDPGGEDVQQLQQHCRDLESQLDSVKIEIVKLLSEKKAFTQENSVLKNHLANLKNCVISEVSSISKDIACGEKENVSPNLTCSNEVEDKEVITNLVGEKNEVADLMKKMKEIEESHLSTVSTLKDRCADLEKSLALMRDEYERCEDYWAGKIEEERQIAEEEQKFTDEKFAELLSKIREYEELSCVDHPKRSCHDGRLETIEERDGLEKQVTDLEEELEEFRVQTEKEILDKDAEISLLRDQISKLRTNFCDQSCSTDVAIQVSDLEAGGYGSDRTYIINLQRNPLTKHMGTSSDSSPSERAIPNNLHSSSFSSDSTEHRSDEDNRENSRAVRLHKQHFRRLRHHLPYSTANPLNYRHSHTTGVSQEMHLQHAFHSQQQQAQTLYQRSWNKHKHDVSELEKILQSTHEKLEQQSQICRDQVEKLTKSDILVKELYVENAHLLATIQNLEQRYHMLMRQHGSISSSENCSSL